MTYENLIKEGDKIEILWSNPDTFPTPGIVLCKPGATGEMWEIQTDDGMVLALNPYSHSLEGIVRKPKDD